MMQSIHENYTHLLNNIVLIAMCIADPSLDLWQKTLEKGGMMSNFRFALPELGNAPVLQYIAFAIISFNVASA